MPIGVPTGTVMIPVLEIVAPVMPPLPTKAIVTCELLRIEPLILSLYNTAGDTPPVK
ncbi:hypothetical protein D9M69_668920 [compost metagenome]